MQKINNQKNVGTYHFECKIFEYILVNQFFKKRVTNNQSNI